MKPDTLRTPSILESWWKSAFLTTGDQSGISHKFDLCLPLWLCLHGSHPSYRPGRILAAGGMKTGDVQ